MPIFANTGTFYPPERLLGFFHLKQANGDPLPVPPSGVWHLRRLLYLCLPADDQPSLTLNLDRSRPVFYVLQSPSLTELAVVDAECTKAGLPRPVLPVSVGPLMEPAAFFYPHAGSGLARAARTSAVRRPP